MKKSNLLKKRGLLYLLSGVLVSSQNVVADVPLDNSYSITLHGEPEFVDEIYDTIDNLPEYLRKYIKDKNVHFEIVDREGIIEQWYNSTPGIYQPVSAIRGYSAVHPNDILIAVESFFRNDFYSVGSCDLTLEELNKNLVISTIVHELGHALDVSTEGVTRYSSSQEFCNIYYNSIADYSTTYEFRVSEEGVEQNISTSREFFASSFVCYTLWPDELNEKCPELYNYYCNLQESYEERMSYEARGIHYDFEQDFSDNMQLSLERR